MPSKDIAVSVRGLSKSYSIAHNAVQHSTMGEALVHRFKNPFHRPEREIFWALKDVDFDIHQGDVVGIIGRNGAGKSTLLKVLSRITEPTTGKAILNGRVGSLLEVGTGFHAELTGRENIYMNGAILGMTKREITRQFDAIVDFSGVEQFLDTPVKRYSSGMYVRLAFAVAAHLNPEILIVDEVLAVGDAEFQKKCLGKMQDVAKSGRTVLFVSHHMQSVSLLCSHALFMERGHVTYIGDVPGAIRRYMDSFEKVAVITSDPQRRPGTGQYRYTSVSAGSEFFEAAEEKVIHFHIEKRGATAEDCYVSCLVRDENGTTLVQLDGRLLGHSVFASDHYQGTIRIRTPWLKPGHYRVDMYIFNNAVIDEVENACTIHVIPVFPYRVATDAGATTLGAVCADFSIEKTLEETQDSASNYHDMRMLAH